MHIALHANPSLLHQQEHGQWFTEGLKRHGVTLDITPDRQKEADIHIVSGPHYALNHWLDHPRVIYIDRACYHDELSGQWKSMDWISVGWLRDDGGRYFYSTGGREAPEVKDCPDVGGTIFLADHGGAVERADTIRRHPADEKHTEPLRTVLRRHRTAIGYNSTALVYAGLEGLRVVCKDKRNVMYEPNWLELIPYADWRYNEIQSGALIEHLWQRL